MWHVYPIETAKQNGLVPFKYLMSVFEKASLVTFSPLKLTDTDIQGNGNKEIKDTNNRQAVDSIRDRYSFEKITIGLVLEASQLQGGKRQLTTSEDYAMVRSVKLKSLLLNKDYKKAFRLSCIDASPSGGIGNRGSRGKPP